MGYVSELRPLADGMGMTMVHGDGDSSLRECHRLRASVGSGITHVACTVQQPVKCSTTASLWETPMPSGSQGGLQKTPEEARGPLWNRRELRPG